MLQALFIKIFSFDCVSPAQGSFSGVAESTAVTSLWSDRPASACTTAAHGLNITH